MTAATLTAAPASATMAAKAMKKSAPRVDRKLVGITRKHHTALKRESARRKRQELPGNKLQQVLDETLEAGLASGWPVAVAVTENNHT